MPGCLVSSDCLLCATPPASNRRSRTWHNRSVQCTSFGGIPRAALPHQKRYSHVETKKTAKRRVTAMPARQPSPEAGQISNGGAPSIPAAAESRLLLRGDDSEERRFPRAARLPGRTASRRHAPQRGPRRAHSGGSESGEFKWRGPSINYGGSGTGGASGASPASQGRFPAHESCTAPQAAARRRVDRRRPVRRGNARETASSQAPTHAPGKRRRHGNSDRLRLGCEVVRAAVYSASGWP